MVGQMGGRRTKRDVKTLFQGRPHLPLSDGSIASRFLSVAACIELTSTEQPLNFENLALEVGDSSEDREREVVEDMS